MINFYLFPFFQEQSNWKRFQRLFDRFPLN